MGMNVPDEARVIGRNMKAARVGVDMTQRQMAAALGVGLRQYGTWERGKPRPLLLAARFCDLTGSSLEALRQPRNGNGSSRGGSTAK